MSTMTLVQGQSSVLAAWETDGQVYFANVKSGTASFSQTQSAPGSSKGRKHPVLAVNAQGEKILVWTEGTGWQKGGALAWQVFDKNGKPTAERGRLDGGIPVWGLPTVVATDAGFMIFH